MLYCTARALVFHCISLLLCCQFSLAWRLFSAAALLAACAALASRLSGAGNERRGWKKKKKKKDKAWIELLRREKVSNRGVNTVCCKKVRQMQTDVSPVPARHTTQIRISKNINFPTKGGVRENAGVRSFFRDFSGTPHVCHVALDLLHALIGS